MKKFISYSGGTESTAMCVLFGNKANAIFADTGFEHAKLYDRIDLVEKKVREFHNNNFKIVKVKNEKWNSLPAYIKHYKYYPSFKKRFCTREFKIEPIDEYLKKYKNKGVELMIGLNIDEAGLRTGNHGNLPFVKYSYPLIENGISRAMCENILGRLDLQHFPAYMKRGGCIGCYYKSKKEYAVMVHLSPAEIDQVIEIEESIQDRRTDYFSIKEDIPNMRKFKDAVLKQEMMFSKKDSFPTINNLTKCGVFCNR